MTSAKKQPAHKDQARALSKAERRKRTSSLAAAGGMANVSLIVTYQSGLFEPGDLDIVECRHEVMNRIWQVCDGNTVHVVGLLMAQGLALNSIFTKLAVKAAEADEREPHQMETYLRLALKAQSQSRATLEALLAVGKPPVLFAQQANVAFGPQQVNNGTTQATTAPPISQMQTTPNELLEDSTHERTQMDPRATPTAGREDTRMEPVGAVNRPSKSRR
jgi:hypothetical protein